MESPVAEGNITRRSYRGVYQTKWGSWVAKIYDRNKRVTAHLGTYKTAEIAARTYDEAALKIHGHKAMLNFPDPRVSYTHSVEHLSSPSTRVHLGTLRTAEEIHGHKAMLNFPDPHVSYAHSVEHLSSAENCTSKRRRVSQSSHPMLLQEQTKEMDEADYVDIGSWDVGTMGQRGSSVMQSEDELGFINSDGSILSFLMAALEEEPIHQALPDPYIVEAERNVAGLTQADPSSYAYRLDSVTSRFR